MKYVSSVYYIRQLSQGGASTEELNCAKLVAVANFRQIDAAVLNILQLLLILDAIIAKYPQ